MLDTIIEVKQLPIDDASKQALIDARRIIFFDETDSLTERLFTGNISIGQWEEFMKKMIRELYASTAAIARGGWDEMTSQDWGRLGPVLKDQYRFLHGYAEYVSDNRDTVSMDYLKNRARMYARPMGHVSAMMTAGIELSHMLPWMPGDMSTDCDGNCKCFWELYVTKVEGNIQQVRAMWRLTDAEHCATCIDRDGVTLNFEIDKSVKVPRRIGVIG